MNGEGVAAVNAALRAEALALGSATLYEASRLPCFLPATLRPVWPGAAVVGAALPVRQRPVTTCRCTWPWKRRAPAR